VETGGRNGGVGVGGRAGGEVGHTTLIEGEKVRTGVTAVVPRGKRSNDSVFAAWFSQNGDGEMTGTFKGGIGTASRRAGEHTVGVLVQCNCGSREQLLVTGVPVGREIPDGVLRSGDRRLDEVGLARTGATSDNSSGDIFLAFSTANPNAADPDRTVSLRMTPNNLINPLFQATVEATEEAIINAMVAAETMTGMGGRTVIGLPHDKLQQALQKYNRRQR
jgi:L-aminopeptidase/D-esterase-like protein